MMNLWNSLKDRVDGIMNLGKTKNGASAMLNIGVYGVTSSGKTHVLYSLIEWGLKRNYLTQVSGIKLVASNTTASGYEHAVTWNHNQFRKYISRGLYMDRTTAQDALNRIYECKLVMDGGKELIVRFADIPGEAFKLNTDEQLVSEEARKQISQLDDRLHPLQVTEEAIAQCGVAASEAAKKLVRDHFVPFYFVTHHADVILVCDPQPEQQEYLPNLAQTIASHRSKDKQPVLIMVATKCDENSLIKTHLATVIGTNLEKGTCIVMDKIGPEVIPGQMLTSFCGSVTTGEPFVSFKRANTELLTAKLDDAISGDGVRQCQQRMPIGFHDIWLSILLNTGHWSETRLAEHLAQQGLDEPGKRALYLERLKSATHKP